MHFSFKGDGKTFKVFLVNRKGKEQVRILLLLRAEQFTRNHCSTKKVLTGNLLPWQGPQQAGSWQHDSYSGTSSIPLRKRALRLSGHKIVHTIQLLVTPCFWNRTTTGFSSKGVVLSSVGSNRLMPFDLWDRNQPLTLFCAC